MVDFSPAIILFSLLLLAGQIVFAFSAVSTEGVFWMALLGRVIFGLGGESLNGKCSVKCSGIDYSSGALVQRKGTRNESRSGN